MKNKIRIGMMTLLCIVAVSCGGGASKPSGKVLFESGDKKVQVYESEVEGELERSLFAQGLNKADIPKEQLDGTIKNITQSIALTKAMALEAKAKKLDTDKKYTGSLELMKGNILATLNIASEMNKVTVSDDEAKKFYDANIGSFSRPDDFVKLQLIVINSGDQAKADAALKEALANPNGFSEVVKKYTEAPNENLGETQDLPVTELAKTHGPIVEALKTVQKGQVANSVIKIGNEWFIVKLLNKESKGAVPFDQVKEMVKNQLKAQKRQQENEKYVKSIMDKYNIK